MLDIDSMQNGGIPNLGIEELDVLLILIPKFLNLEQHFETTSTINDFLRNFKLIYRRLILLFRQALS